LTTGRSSLLNSLGGSQAGTLGNAAEVAGAGTLIFANRR
jgi:hypothetical protein